MAAAVKGSKHLMMILTSTSFLVIRLCILKVLKMILEGTEALELIWCKADIYLHGFRDM